MYANGTHHRPFSRFSSFDSCLTDSRNNPFWRVWTMIKDKAKKQYNPIKSQIILIMCVVMILATGTSGVLLTVRSVREMRSEVWNHHASVAEVAATMIDGDDVKMITEE